MNITDLTPHQLRRAAAIKEKLDGLNKELRRLLDGAVTDGATSGKKRRMSATVKKENCGCAESAMGEGEAGIRSHPNLSQRHHRFNAIVWLIALEVIACAHVCERE